MGGEERGGAEYHADSVEVIRIVFLKSPRSALNEQLRPR